MKSPTPPVSPEERAKKEVRAERKALLARQKSAKRLTNRHAKKARLQERRREEKVRKAIMAQTVFQ